jgi:beta-glucosidase
LALADAHWAGRGRSGVRHLADLARPAGTPRCPAGRGAGLPGLTGRAPVYLDTHYSYAERAADLVSCMTLSQKVAQLRTRAPAIPSLGLQKYIYWSEGQHGVNVLGADDDNGGTTAGVHATSFPVNFAPTVNMDRDPRWGRTDEAFGEDPYLTSQMSDAYVDGYQGQTMSGRPMTAFLKVAATAKHYALNNVEDDRTSDSSDITDADIRDYYTAPFASLTRDAHVAGLMTSYNAINGTPSVADTYTTNELSQRTSPPASRSAGPRAARPSRCARAPTSTAPAPRTPRPTSTRTMTPACSARASSTTR